jgi:hypothetical protein
MDLKAYYRKRREAEERLPEPCVVVSLETADGGKAGVRTEVRRALAAKMIVDGVARQATAEEAKTFQDEKVEAKRVAEQLAAASRMQVTVVPSSEWRKTKG